MKNRDSFLSKNDFTFFLDNDKLNQFSFTLTVKATSTLLTNLSQQSLEQHGQIKCFCFRELTAECYNVLRIGNEQ